MAPFRREGGRSPKCLFSKWGLILRGGRTFLLSHSRGERHPIRRKRRRESRRFSLRRILFPGGGKGEAFGAKGAGERLCRRK